MSELYGVTDPLPPDIADTVLDDNKPETPDNAEPDQ